MHSALQLYSNESYVNDKQTNWFQLYDIKNKFQPQHMHLHYKLQGPKLRFPDCQCKQKFCTGNQNFSTGRQQAINYFMPQ